MHYTARNLSIASFALMVINFLCAIVTYLHLYVVLEGTMFIRPIICLFLITSVAMLICGAFTQWFINKDTYYDSQEMTMKTEALSKRIDELEKQLKALKYEKKA